MNVKWRRSQFSVSRSQFSSVKLNMRSEVAVTMPTPMDKNRTRLRIFDPSAGHDTLIGAVKGWASGKNMSCPDMTKIG